MVNINTLTGGPGGLVECYYTFDLKILCLPIALVSFMARNDANSINLQMT